MNWSFDTDRPIYLQLKEHLLLLIISGVYLAGSKLPAVRDMATAAVNPNTLQKTLFELKRAGLVYLQRTRGSFVTTDEKMILQVKKYLTYEQIEQFLKKMDDLGYTREETLSLIERIAKK